MRWCQIQSLSRYSSWINDPIQSLSGYKDWLGNLYKSWRLVEWNTKFVYFTYLYIHNICLGFPNVVSWTFQFQTVPSGCCILFGPRVLNGSHSLRPPRRDPSNLHLAPEAVHALAFLIVSLVNILFDDLIHEYVFFYHKVHWLIDSATCLDLDAVTGVCFSRKCFKHWPNRSPMW